MFKEVIVNRPANDVLPLPSSLFHASVIFVLVVVWGESVAELPVVRLVARIFFIVPELFLGKWSKERKTDASVTSLLAIAYKREETVADATTVFLVALIFLIVVDVSPSVTSLFITCKREEAVAEVVCFVAWVFLIVAGISLRVVGREGKDAVLDKS